MLRNKSISVSEVAYICGFSNPKYFSTCFKEEFGVTPKEFQKSDTSQWVNFNHINLIYALSWISTVFFMVDIHDTL